MAPMVLHMVESMMKSMLATSMNMFMARRMATSMARCAATTRTGIHHVAACAMVSLATLMALSMPISRIISTDDSHGVRKGWCVRCPVVCHLRFELLEALRRSFFQVGTTGNAVERSQKSAMHEHANALRTYDQSSSGLWVANTVRCMSV